MAQNFSIRAGLKKFGSKGEKSVSNELTQLHTMSTYYPVDPTTLTKNQNLDALNSLMFLIEKWNGEIKARACSDGSKQRKQENYRKQDNASPTCSNEVIMITSTIEAHEERDVAIIDIPGAFLYAHTDELIYMLLRCPLAELMVMVDPVLYKDFIT